MRPKVRKGAKTISMRERERERKIMKVELAGVAGRRRSPLDTGRGVC